MIVTHSSDISDISHIYKQYTDTVSVIVYSILHFDDLDIFTWPIT